MKWLGSLLWCEFSSWPRNVVGAAPTKQNKQTKNQNAHRDLNQECYFVGVPAGAQRDWQCLSGANM